MAHHYGFVGHKKLLDYKCPDGLRLSLLPLASTLAEQNMAVYPLSLLPTVADDPNKMEYVPDLFLTFYTESSAYSSRRSLPFIMALMKVLKVISLIGG